MMVFNSFTAVNDYNFGTQMTKWLSIFLPTNELLKGFAKLLWGSFLKEVMIIVFVFETIL